MREERKTFCYSMSQVLVDILTRKKVVLSFRLGADKTDISYHRILFLFLSLDLKPPDPRSTRALDSVRL